MKSEDSQVFEARADKTGGLTRLSTPGEVISRSSSQVDSRLSTRLDLASSMSKASESEYLSREMTSNLDPYSDLLSVSQNMGRPRVTETEALASSQRLSRSGRSSQIFLTDQGQEGMNLPPGEEENDVFLYDDNPVNSICGDTREVRSYNFHMRGFTDEFLYITKHIFYQIHVLRLDNLGYNAQIFK